MRTKQLLYIVSLFLITLTTSCERPIIPGISDEEMLQEQLLGGWETINVKTYISHAAIPGTGSLSDKMQENLEQRVYPSFFYITEDSIFFIQNNDFGTPFVKSASAYQLGTDPMRIIPENQYMMCDEYAPYYYVKSEGETICFYLTKPECLDMIEKDGTFDGWMGLIRQFIDDAQFEFYLKKNNNLGIYQDIDKGIYPKDDHFKNQ